MVGAVAMKKDVLLKDKALLVEKLAKEKLRMKKFLSADLGINTADIRINRIERYERSNVKIIRSVIGRGDSLTIITTDKDISRKEKRWKPRR